jgi:hypothetical protein
MNASAIANRSRRPLREAVWTGEDNLDTGNTIRPMHASRALAYLSLPKCLGAKPIIRHVPYADFAEVLAWTWE